MSALCAVTVPIVTEPRTNCASSSTATCMSATAASAALCIWQSGLARGGEPHGATRPVQQWLAEFALQPLDLRADRGLRDVDPLGRAGEVGLFGDGDEVLELPKFHNQ